MRLGVSQILRIHRTKGLILLNGTVKGIHQLNKERVPADLLEERFFHLTTLMPSSRMIFSVLLRCGCSSMVELQPSKLAMRVRSPSPAPTGLGPKKRRSASAQLDRSIAFVVQSTRLRRHCLGCATLNCATEPTLGVLRQLAVALSVSAD